MENNKKFDAMKKYEQKNNTPDKAKTSQRKLTETVITIGIHMSHKDAQHMARHVQDGGRQNHVQRPEQTNPQR